jgi:hypothetical protein
MNEVIIPIKLAGLGEMKAELKQIKSDLVTATDPAEIERLSTRAGELNQKLKDTNKTIKNFSTGSTVQQVGNQISGIKDSLMNLDFKKASTQVTAFTATVSKFKVSDLTKGLGLLTSAVGKLGAQFLKMGLQLLTNPIFLLVAIIVAIVLAFTVWEDKLGKFGTALKIAFFGIYILVEAVKLLIEGFKKLTDWLGLTSFAADDNAERVKAAAEKSTEASKKRTEQISQYYDQEIAMARAAGKDTVVLEIQKSKELEAQAKLRLSDAQKTLASMAHMVGTAAEEEKQKLRDKITEENEIIRGADNSREVMYAANVKKVEDNAKKVADNARAVAKALNDKRIADQKTFDTNRLNAERQIEDLRIAAIKDDAVREGELLKEKYERLRADLLKDATKTDKEKKDLKAAFDLAETNEQAKIDEAKKQKENEAYQALNALKIANMVEGEAKIAEQQKVAYNQSINAAKEKYGADSVLFIEFQEQLAIADAATTKARSDKKIADQQALLNSLNELGLTDDQRKIAAIEAQYLKEQELANGNAETLLALENKHKKDIEKVENDAAIERIEKEKQVRDAKLTFAKDTVDGLTNLGGMLIKDQKKLEKFNKASALIQIGIDTAKAISALVAAANTNPLNAVTAGGAGIAQFASGIIQIATNIAKAKQLLTSPSTPVTAGGGDTGGGDTGGGGSNTATMIPQAAQLFGSSNNANTMSAGGDSSGGGTNMMVTAVVSETQITNVQKKINMINKNSEL